MEKIIKTEYGLVSGLDTPICDKYLGIPFAKPPIGELRFKHPQKCDKWEGIYKATSGSHNPIQAPSSYEYKYTSEDCLYLNIFVPKNIDKPLPVTVWIYGGSYANGGIGCMEEKGEFVHDDLGVFCNETNTVAVSINYRVNMFGFFNFHALDERFDINNGLYDLKMGLEFVRDNIAAFGGDQTNITVFGESAGGALTLSLLSSPLTSNLFQKAIVQSPCVEHFWTYEKGKKVALTFIKKAKIKSNDIYRGILDMSNQTFRYAYDKTMRKFLLRGELTSLSSPIIDGIFLKEQPCLEVINKTHPLLIGFTKDEGDIFVRDISPLILRLMKFVVPYKIKKIKGRTFRECASIGLANYVFKEPVLKIASSYIGKVWVYEYNHISAECKKLNIRSSHASELAPLFKMDMAFGKANDSDLILIGEWMRKLWKKIPYDEMDYKTYKESKEIIEISKEKILEEKSK